MDASIQYNLKNPALTDDIGMTLIERQYPSTIDPVTGVPDIDLKDVQINNGQPDSDSFNGKTKKESHWLRNSLLAIGAVGLAALGIFKGKSIYRICKNSITNLLSKIKK